MKMNRYAAFTMLAGLAAQSLPAQVPAGHDSAADSAHRRVPLVRPRDLLMIGGLAGAVVAAMPADRGVQRTFQRPGAQANSASKGISKITGGLGDPGSVIISAGIYFAGLASHSRRTAALGMHTGESVVLGGVISEVLKGEIGRARPKFSPNDSKLFKAGKGFSSDNYASFPSTETTAAFAAATALSLGINRDWPGHAGIVTPLAYGAATGVAFSRLYRNEHWLTDVVAGAGIGIASGVFVDRFNRRYPDNIFEKWFLPASVVPTRGGFAVAWSR